MSLKGFHVLLITLSSLLALMFGGWSLRAWTATRETSHLALALFSFAAAAGLAVYVIWFYRKIRTRAEEDRERRRRIKPLAVMAAGSQGLPEALTTTADRVSGPAGP